MSGELRVFVSSVQKELEDERVIVQNLLNTDAFLSAHVAAVLYEFEPASPGKALKGCLKSLEECQVYLLIIAAQYGTLVGKLSITHAEYRHAKKKKLPVLALLVAGEKLTSRRCEHEFGITRDTATRDFGLLMELGLAARQGRGRSTSYVLAGKI